MLQSQFPITNRVLASMSRLDIERIGPELEDVRLDVGQILQEANEPIKYVYFANDALVSLLSPVSVDTALAVGLVGNEGVVGTSVILGVQQTTMRSVVQTAGTALRMQSPIFIREFERNGALRQAVLQYVHFLMTQFAQTAACNRFHFIEARLARWLLMTRNRLSRDHLQLTHEFLGYLLGVPRAGVTLAAHGLKKQKLIDYSRGNIEILNVPGLEAVACTCLAQDKRAHASP